jgi:hypothetical protein
MKLLRELVKRYRAWARARADAELPTLETCADRIIVHTKHGAAQEILFAEVVRLEIYKMDLITVDLVCLDVTLRASAAGLRTYTIHEDMPGWGATSAALGAQFGFDQGDIGRIWNPAFKECRTVLFDAAATGDAGPGMLHRLKLKSSSHPARPAPACSREDHQRVRQSGEACSAPTPSRPARRPTRSYSKE